MYKVTGLSDNYNQTLGISLYKASSITLGLHYYATQESWMYDLEYEDLKIKNQRLHISYNMLDKYKNVIPFGLLVRSLDGGEPLFLKDFVIPRIELYILDSSEVKFIHTYFYRSFIYDYE